ncbi:MAG: hypothetical protein AB8I08_13360, partial [Sandaracinaceae bacterium]
MRVIEEGGARVELREVDGVHVHAWIGQASVLTVDAYYEALETIVERGERLVIVTETSQAGVPGADVRARIGVRQNALEPRLRPLS